VGVSVEEIKRMMRSPEKKPEKRVLLSSGSTLINLACSDSVEGAFLVGHYYFVPGDSMSGKTWLGMSCFAEAANDGRFDGYRLIYDPTEAGALMDLEEFFGKRAAGRIEHVDPPSGTAREFYYNAHDALKDERPCIYVLDSQDSLSSEEEQEKFVSTKEAHRKGKTTAGSYGDGKPKIHSANLRTLINPLRESGSILIVLNQTRDSFDQFKPTTYSGGRALLFYATLQLWSKVKERIKKSVHSKPRQLGVVVKVMVKKNRLTGKERTVEVPIYHSFGIDDVGSCVDYLVDEKTWSKTGNGFIEATGLGPTFKKRRDDLIRKIEEEGMVEDLRSMVQKTWDEVEQECRVVRKKRYE